MDYRILDKVIGKLQDSIESSVEETKNQLANGESASLYDSTRNAIVLKSDEPVLNFKCSYNWISIYLNIIYEMKWRFSFNFEYICWIKIQSVV